MSRYESPMCFRKVSLVKDYRDVIGSEMTCDICGDSFTVEKSMYSLYLKLMMIIAK